jgi:hypothetical protein
VAKTLSLLNECDAFKLNRFISLLFLPAWCRFVVECPVRLGHAKAAGCKSMAASEEGRMDGLKRATADLQKHIRGLDVSIDRMDGKVQYEITMNGHSLASRSASTGVLPGDLADTLEGILGKLQDDDVNQLIELIRRRRLE